MCLSIIGCAKHGPGTVDLASISVTTREPSAVTLEIGQRGSRYNSATCMKGYSSGSSQALPRALSAMLLRCLELSAAWLCQHCLFAVYRLPPVHCDSARSVRDEPLLRPSPGAGLNASKQIMRHWRVFVRL